MKPIIAEAFDKINDKKIKRIFSEKSTGEEENSLKSEDDLNQEPDYPKRLGLKETDGTPQKIDAVNLGIYYQNGKEFRTGPLAGIMPIYEYEKRNADYYWCIKPSWGDPLKMLDLILQSDDINDDKVYQMFEPKVKTRQEWIDYCKAEKLTGKDSDFLMGIVSDEPEIDIGYDSENDDKNPQLVADSMNVFEIYDYIIQLEKICKRVLKQQSLPIEENMTGKVKGRVVINKQIKTNLSKGRIDRNYCCYNKMSIDTTENRILKYALYLCKKWSSQRTSFMSDKMIYCDNILKNVKLVKVTKADICSVKTNGAFKDYKKGIEKAKRIIQKMAFTFNGDSDTENKEIMTRKVKPFFLRMDLLFELYTRTLVREALKGIEGGNQLEDYSNNEKKLFFEEDGIHPIHPMGFQNTNIADILIKDSNGKYVCVLDAKYSMLSEGYSNRIRGNTHQLLAYMLIYGAKAGGFIHPINNDENTLMHLHQKSNICFKNVDENADGLITLVNGKSSESTVGNIKIEGQKVRWKSSEKSMEMTISDNFEISIPEGEYWISDKVKVKIINKENEQVRLEFTRGDKPKNQDLYSIYVENKGDDNRNVSIQEDMIKQKFDIFTGLGFSIGLRKPVLGKNSEEKDSNVERMKKFLEETLNEVDPKTENKNNK